MQFDKSLAVFSVGTSDRISFACSWREVVANDTGSVSIFPIWGSTMDLPVTPYVGILTGLLKRSMTLWLDGQHENT